MAPDTKEGTYWGLTMAASRRATVLLLLLASLSISHAALEAHQPPTISGVGRADGSLQWRRSIAEGPSTVKLIADNSSFILAADRTYRKDPTGGYQYYTGGWNISNEHYWASVAFSAIPLFIISAVWFAVFGLVLLLMCCCCCCRRRNYSESSGAYALSLILLILFTSAAIIGCIVLYDGQGKFYRSTKATLDYVVGQADFTVQNLRNFSNNLESAKMTGVDQIFLPADLQENINIIERKLNASANELASRTSDNSKKIHKGLDAVERNLIFITAVMLILALLGFLFSILGMQFLVYILVIIGWILVAATFILCGVFLLFHNVVADTCVAMEEWVDHPHAHTALDDILPCVDVATANESMYRGKEVTSQLVNLVNKVIVNISNADVPPGNIPFYYNQSGPLMPVLCNPYEPDMSNRTCVSGEVDFNNASLVWKGYMCTASSMAGFEICTAVGRVTPSIYDQMTAATSLSHGLYYYGPFLVGLEDCTFVRDTFSSISTNNCPGLRQYSGYIFLGLFMVSAAVMMSLVFWVVFARERRHRRYNKQFLSRSALPAWHLQDKGP